MSRRVLLSTMDREVQAEIDDHPNWCSEGCKTFLPEEYRKKRIMEASSAEALQQNYDSCHAFR